MARTQTSSSPSSSDTSTFDPTSILDSEYSDDLSTRLTPVPEGEYYARVKQIDVKALPRKDGTGTVKIAEVTFAVEDDEVKKALNMQEPQVRLRPAIFLDLNPDGTLQTKEQNANANVKLGRLKEALGFKPGRPWSLRRMEGQYCHIKVRHRTDENDIETTYADVVSVSAEPFKDGKAQRPRDRAA